MARYFRKLTHSDRCDYCGRFYSQAHPIEEKWCGKCNSWRRDMDVACAAKRRAEKGQ